jgi:hypothetical protein
MADLFPYMHQDSLSNHGQSSPLCILGSHLGPHNLGDSVRKEEKNYFKYCPSENWQSVITNALYYSAGLLEMKLM